MGPTIIDFTIPPRFAPVYYPPQLVNLKNLELHSKIICYPAAGYSAIRYVDTTRLLEGTPEGICENVGEKGFKTPLNL